MSVELIKLIFHTSIAITVAGIAFLIIMKIRPKIYFESSSSPDGKRAVITNYGNSVAYDVNLCLINQIDGKAEFKEHYVRDVFPLICLFPAEAVSIKSTLEPGEKPENPQKAVVTWKNRFGKKSKQYITIAI